MLVQSLYSLNVIFRFTLTGHPFTQEQQFTILLDLVNLLVLM